MLVCMEETKPISDEAISAAAAALGRKGGLVRVPKGLARVSKRKKKAIQKLGAAAAWANVPPEVRAAEMSRRRLMGIERKKAEAEAAILRTRAQPQSKKAPR